MPSLINRYPSGLLSLLGIKALGNAPSVLPDQVAPIIDLGPFYLNDAAVYRDGSTGAVSSFGFQQITALAPPAGKVWIVNSAVIAPSTVLGAGTSYTYRLAVGRLSDNVAINMAAASTTTTAGLRPAGSIVAPFIVRPEYGLGVYVEAFTLGIAYAFTIRALITELDI